MNDGPQRMTPTGRLVPDDLDDEMVAAVVAAFYAKARRDEVIGPVFNRVVAADHWPEHIQTITDFWSSMLLGTRRYRAFAAATVADAISIACGPAPASPSKWTDPSVR